MKIDPKLIDRLAKGGIAEATNPKNSKPKRILAGVIAVIAGAVFWYLNQSCSILPDTRIETPSGTIIHFTPKVSPQK